MHGGGPLFEMTPEPQTAPDESAVLIVSATPYWA